MGGWTGKLLRVNLTTSSSTVEDIPDEWCRDYIGGRGLAARYLYEEWTPPPIHSDLITSSFSRPDR